MARRRYRTGVDTATLDRIHERHGHECAYCGFPSEVIDHVVPWSAGGHGGRIWWPRAVGATT